MITDEHKPHPINPNPSVEPSAHKVSTQEHEHRFDRDGKCRICPTTIALLFRESLGIPEDTLYLELIERRARDLHGAFIAAANQKTIEECIEIETQRLLSEHSNAANTPPGNKVDGDDRHLAEEWWEAEPGCNLRNTDKSDAIWGFTEGFKAAIAKIGLWNQRVAPSVVVGVEKKEEPTQLFLCEIPSLILRENQLYIFQAAPGCEKCQEYLNPPRNCLGEPRGELAAAREGQKKFLHNPNHPCGTCSDCGEEMVWNVPRLGPAGGFIHKATGRYNCGEPDIKAILSSHSNAVLPHPVSETEDLELLRQRAEAGDKFKAFVHSYLTQHGVPEGDPTNQHQIEGCRIGARLDLLLARPLVSESPVGSTATGVEDEKAWLAWWKRNGFGMGICENPCRIAFMAGCEAKSLSERIYNTEESKAILDLCERQGLSQKQLLRQALREYQSTVLGPVDLGPKAPPSLSEPKELEEEKKSLGEPGAI